MTCPACTAAGWLFLIGMLDVLMVLTDRGAARGNRRFSNAGILMHGELLLRTHEFTGAGADAAVRYRDSLMPIEVRELCWEAAHILIASGGVG